MLWLKHGGGQVEKKVEHLAVVEEEWALFSDIFSKYFKPFIAAIIAIKSNKFIIYQITSKEMFQE